MALRFRLRHVLLGSILILSLVSCQGLRASREQQGRPPLAESESRQTATLAPTLSPAPPSPQEGAPSLTPTPLPTSALPPAQRLEVAKEATRIGDWSQAFALFESLREDATQGVEALLHLGDLYLRDERPVEAAEAWQGALQRAPSGPLAPALRYRLASMLAGSGDAEQAITLWQQVDADLDQVDHILATRLAAAYQALGQGEAAREQWERAYLFEDGDRVTRARAAFQVAEWYEARQEWDDALQWFERTLELSEIHEYRAGVVARMGRAAEQGGDRARARRQWRILVGQYPDTPEAVSAVTELERVGAPIPPEEVAEIYLQNERWTEALRLLFSLMEEEEATHEGELHALAAEALEGRGDWQAASMEWEKILDTHPEAEALHDDALLGVGRAEQRLGRTVAALRAWERALSEYPEGDAAPEAHWLRAEALRQEGLDAPDIAPLYEQLAQRYPGSDRASESLWQAGMLWYRANEPERALKAWQALARRRDGRRAQALYWAGKAATLTGGAIAAEPFWRLALSQDPMNYYALRSAAQLDGAAWQPRGEGDYRLPGADDLLWLAEATGEASIDPGAAPTHLRFKQGEALLWLGERELALDAFEESIYANGDAPLELWLIANRLHELHLPRLGILAASNLMTRLGYHALSAPPTLAALVYPLPYDGLLRQSAEQYGFDPLFFASLIHQESAWEPRARSHAAARGLTQVIPDTGAWIAARLGDGAYEYRKLDRPLISIQYGSYYLDYVLTEFANNPFHALAAYNAGPGNAQRWRTEDDDLFVEQVSSEETRTYLREVYRRWWAYDAIYRAGD